MPKQPRTKNNADSVGREFALFKCGTPVGKGRREQARSICGHRAQTKEGVQAAKSRVAVQRNKPRQHTEACLVHPTGVVRSAATE